MLKLYDVIIVGGGPAGLAAALGLVRAHRSVLLLDSKQYRNASAPSMQNVLTLDGEAPLTLRNKARQDLSRYPTFSAIEATATRAAQRIDTELQDHPLHKLRLDVQVAQTGMVRVTADGATSAVPYTEESILARRLILACGVRDILPAIPGVEEEWGNTMHVCPYCHGWEHRGTRWGLLVPGDKTGALPAGALGAAGPGFIGVFAPTLRAFGRPPITLFTNGRKVTELGLPEEMLKALQANDCTWVEAPIARFTSTHVTSTTAQPDSASAVLPPRDHGLRVELTDGSSVDVGMMYLRPPFLHSPLVGQLGLKLKEPFMSVDVDMFMKSSHALVYVAGDAMTPMASVGNSMSSGGIAAAGCNHDLASEDWALVLKDAGMEVKAHSQSFAEMGRSIMEKPADKNEAVKAVAAD